MSLYPHITALVIILVNPVSLAASYPDLLDLPVTSRGIVTRSRCIVDRCRSIINRRIVAITTVRTIAKERISQVYTNCPVVITAIVSTVTARITPTMTIVTPMAT
jgi:hypothetical protein